MRIDVAFTPRDDPAECAVAVVIDVLRATTTITQALAAGYRQVLACGEVEQARELAGQVNGTAVLAGERRCVKPEGFDLGTRVGPARIVRLAPDASGMTEVVFELDEPAPETLHAQALLLEAHARVLARLTPALALEPH